MSQGIFGKLAGGRAASGVSEAEIRLAAARTLVSVFDKLYEGAFAVDLNSRITWMNDKFKALIGWNGAQRLEGLPVTDILPHSEMTRVMETGQPDLIDIVDLGEKQITISRIPLTGDDGKVIGAMGVILFDRLNALKPLVSRFQTMQAELKKAQSELAASRQAKYRFENFVGQSAKVLELKKQAQRAAERDVPILLLGETGTGKELLAHAVHATSPRSQAPMVRVNVAAIPEGLLESELFGSVPGAYTGAGSKARVGKFKLADGGTLFLDEIGDMPAALQSKLLRVLQEGELEPVGSNKVESVDVRVISATSRDLPKMVEQGEFRADLYYRLNVLPLEVPPLRSRLEDIAPLCEVLLELINEQAGFAHSSVSEGAIEVLKQHRWPGNVRELKNILEQAAARFDSDVLEAEQVRQLLPAAGSIPLPEGAEKGEAILALSEGQTLKELVAETEKRAIEKALDLEKGVKSRAAKRLGISRAQFYEKLSTYGLNG